MCTYIKDRPVCIVCEANVSVTNEYNVTQHKETKDQNKYKNLDMNEISQNLEEMKRRLISQKHIICF